MIRKRSVCPPGNLKLQDKGSCRVGHVVYDGHNKSVHQCKAWFHWHQAIAKLALPLARAGATESRGAIRQNPKR